MLEKRQIMKMPKYTETILSIKVNKSMKLSLLNLMEVQ